MFLIQLEAIGLIRIITFPSVNFDIWRNASSSYLHANVIYVVLNYHRFFTVILIFYVTLVVNILILVTQIVVIILLLLRTPIKAIILIYILILSRMSSYFAILVVASPTVQIILFLALIQLLTLICLAL